MSAALCTALPVAVLLALAAPVLAAWLVERKRRRRDPGDAAQRIYEADHARWVAECEAYRWKRRALRLGWRRGPGRWDR